MKSLIVLLGLVALVACSEDKVAPPLVPAPIEIAARPLPAPSPPLFQGVLTSRASQMVMSPDTGVIKELRVKAGDIVEAGQVLAILDDPAQRAMAAKMPKRSKARLVIETRLADMKIRAPIGGIVSAIQTTKGSMAKRDMPILRISNTKKLQLRFALPAEQNGTIAKGRKVQATIAGRTTPIQAVVRSVGPTTETPIRLSIVEADLSGIRDTTGLYGALADVTLTN